MYRTGGGPSTASILTPSEEKVKEMILLSVEGMNSLFDCDQIPAIESPELKMIPIVHQDSRIFEDTPIIVEAIEKPDEILVVHEEPKKVMSSNTLISNVSRKQKPKRPFEKLAEIKLEIAAIQKQILEEELQNKRKQWLFEEEEREHERAMWALEKQRYFHQIVYVMLAGYVRKREVIRISQRDANIPVQDITKSAEPSPMVVAQRIVLPDYRQAANFTHNCEFPNCNSTAFHNISDKLCTTVLKDYNFYLPKLARVCNEHMTSNL
ncbi:hypothetical protein evm_003293 [Chilo suppressalis]|nr:hypothetical protein evm_003293 [Chilo suppressalis]